MNDPNIVNNKEKATDLFETIPEHFIMIEDELDQKVYEQFLSELEWLEPHLDYAHLIRQGEQLVTSGESGMSISQKRLALVQLAQWGSAEAYRLVQKYSAHPDQGLEEWSRIALYECRMRMEEDLLGESVGLISTGLGGDGEQLRYIFVLAFCGESPAEAAQQEIRERLDKVCQQYRSVVEQAQFRPACLVVQVLVPMDVAVGEVIEASIDRFNRDDDQVRQEYMATNVAVPTEEEIQQFLDDL